MVTRDVAERIAEFNANLHPAGIKRKYTAMQESPLSFFRGTCHLFYQDLPTAQSLFQTAPHVWLCGDLHLQNFGSYKGEDRQVYFDINDFDEGLLAPCTWDLARFVTSLFVAAASFDRDHTEAETLAQQFLTAYTTALAIGKAHTIQQDNAKGLVADLLEDLSQRERAKFLDNRTESSSKQQSGHRRFKLIDGKTAVLPPAERAMITGFVDRWAQTQPHPEFYQIFDIVQRIAGNGSLGLARYLILVEGKGSPDKNYLLDLKGTRPSSLQPYCTVPQPTWSHPADRIVTIQTQFQQAPPALLHRLNQDDQSYILRELQPSADKIDLADHEGKLKRFTTVVQTMGEVTAWGQIRSSGRQGSAITDDLIAFAQQSPTWQPDLLDYARHYAQQVRSDYQAFQRWQAESLPC
jgi:uncharacterized protein (DUF2252 family)